MSSEFPSGYILGRYGKFPETDISQMFRVGELASPPRTKYPEGGAYQCERGGHVLYIFMARPTAAEIRAVREGIGEFALFVGGPAVVLLFRFADAVRWSDAPFSIHLVPEPYRQIPSMPTTAAERAAIQIVLIDADSGIVRAIRLLSFSPEFTRALHAAIHAQAAQPWDSHAYDKTLEQLLRRFPQTQNMVDAASIRSLGGGE